MELQPWMWYAIGIGTALLVIGRIYFYFLKAQSLSVQKLKLISIIILILLALFLVFRFIYPYSDLPPGPKRTIVVFVSLLVIAALYLYFAQKEEVKIKRAAALESIDSILIALFLVFCIIRPFVVQAFYIPSGSMEPTLHGAEQGGDRILVNKFIYWFKPLRRGDVIVFNAPQRAKETSGKASQKNVDFIKRLIGLPGDIVEIRPGAIYISGRSLDKSELLELLGLDYDYDTPVKLAEEAIYVQGKWYDKRQLSEILGLSEDEIRIEPGLVYINGKPLKEPYIHEDPHFTFFDLGHGYETPYGPVRVPSGHLFVLGDNRNNSNDSHVWGFLPEKHVLGKAMFIFWPPKRIRLIY